MPTHEEITAQLTGPGSAFEVHQEQVLGQPMLVFKNRRRSLFEVLAASSVHGDKPYIVEGDRQISYVENLQQVARLADVFRSQYGIQRGDRVAILAENQPEWITAFWATLSIGGIVTALNAWWTEDEVHYALGLTTPKLLIADRKRLDRLKEQPELPTICIESDFAALLEKSSATELPTTEIDEDDPALILFTSGTTGRPRGAVNTHRGICGFVQCNMLGGLRGIMLAAQAGTPPDPNPPALCALVTSPLFHMSGLFTGAVMMLVVGAKTVWRRGRFDPKDVLRLIESERVTTWAALGSMAPRVLSHPDLERYDLSSLRNLGSGGAPTSPALQERMRKVAPNGAAAISLGYGSSETVTAVSMIGGQELVEHPTSVGKIQPTHEVQIRSDAGQVLAEGEQGEIFVRSPYNMLQYWGDAEATERAIDSARWLATGDIGQIRSGRLYINSRARDMILRAAENIYPVEIEQRLEAHPQVNEAAVIGIDHPELGQEVKAVVVPEIGAKVGADELSAWVGETLAAYKIPVHWQLQPDPLPRNAAGKVLKNVLRGETENRFIED